MKIYNGIWVVVIVITLILLLFFFISQSDNNSFSNTEKETVISGKVFDYHTKKLLDSVDLKIYGSISGDLFLDTTLAQKDSFLFVFITKMAYEDEPFWYFATNDAYYFHNKYSYWEFDSTNIITPGKPSHCILYLKPASRINIVPQKISLDSCSLSISLIQPNKDTIEYEWAPYTGPLEEPHKRDCWEFEYDYDRPVAVKASWIVDRKAKKDTFYQEIKLIPFDTIDLKIQY